MSTEATEPTETTPLTEVVVVAVPFDDELSSECLKRSFKMINDNIAAYIFAKMEKTIKKEYKNKSVVKEFKKFLREASAEIEIQVDKLYTSNDLIPKLDALDALTAQSDINARPKRIFDDLNETFDAFNFEHKKKCLEGLIEIDNKYELICQSLQNDILKKNAELVKNMSFN